MDRTYTHLTPNQVDSFMKHGFLRLESCFSRLQASSWTSSVWTRLDMVPTDKTTWTRERTNMPTHRTEDVKNFVPKAWTTICELLGGEERVATEASKWGDGFIVNLGTPEWEGSWPDPKELDGWHVDGDFFMHFLDSREQALLVIPLFTDVVEHAGGTVIGPDAISAIAKHLYDHPEGVSPLMVPRGQRAMHEGLGFYSSIIKQCKEFHEMTGNVGDVILMHPLMVHSASQPFNLNRERVEDFSLVELKTLQVLGKERLEGWKITAPRDRIVPDAWKVKDEMKILELKRLAKIEQLKVY